MVESEETLVTRDDREAREMKSKIADPPTAYNPRPEPFEWDDPEIAEHRSRREEQARTQRKRLRLTPPVAGLARQWEIYWDHPGPPTPYWHWGAKADQLF
jgi:hypothetical protein